MAHHIFRSACRQGPLFQIAVIIVTLALLLSLMVVTSKPTEKIADSAILALVIFRHGQRTPSSTYPNDAYKDESFWPDGWGALTQTGKVNAFNFGKWLRNRYDPILPETYSEKDVYVLSSDMDRCIMSAQLCLAGLYPPKGRQKWSQDILWQPVPVHTVPRQDDKLILLRRNCPKYQQLLKEVIQSIGSNSTDLYQFLSNHTGLKIRNDVDVESLYNTLEIEEDAGYKLPEWTSTVYPNILRNIAVRGQRLFTNTTTMKRLFGGPLISHILEHIGSRINNQDNRKLYLYSAHDMTLMSVMEALGVDYFYKPDPLDALIFEVHRLPSGYHIQVSYLNHTGSARLQSLHVLGQKDPLILLTTFVQQSSNMRPRSWQNECNSP